MQLTRPARVLIVLVAALLAGESSAFSPAGPSTTGRHAPTEAEVPAAGVLLDGVDELRDVERRVREVSRAAIPATVHVLVIGAGYMSQGSGVVIDPDGTVLTAAHVIGRSGRRCTLTFPDGEQVRGRTLGLNHELDCGMIEIVGEEDREFPFVPLGDERELESGDWCMAFGHPGGIVEGRDPVVRLGRLQPDRWMAPFMCTDCAIIQGDSGGPLLDLEGKLIGIHSRIQARVVSNFHVPASKYRENWQRLLNKDPRSGEFRLQTARLGVRGEAASPGVRLTEIMPDTAAEDAGLRRGDVVLKFGDTPLRSFDDLRTAIRAKRPGDKLGLLVQRDRERLTIEVELGAQDN